MNAAWFRGPLAWAVAAVVLVLIALSCFVIVPETKQAVILRMRQPHKIINAYQRGEQFGGSTPITTNGNHRPGSNGRSCSDPPTLACRTRDRRSWGAVSAQAGIYVIKLDPGRSVACGQAVRVKSWGEQ